MPKIGFNDKVLDKEVAFDKRVTDKIVFMTKGNKPMGMKPMPPEDLYYHVMHIAPVDLEVLMQEFGAEAVTRLVAEGLNYAKRSKYA
jgi:hypothetical protein